MSSLARLLGRSEIILIKSPIRNLCYSIYADTDEQFTKVINTIVEEYKAEIKEERLLLKNTSMYPSYCLEIKFKEEADEAFFLLRVN